jgi:galactose mutarotase-like enzyme
MLTYTLTIENHGEESMPIAPGFHPYFTVAQEKKPALVTDGPAGFSVGDFDWATSIPDSPYPFTHTVRVEIPGSGVLTMEELPQDGKYSLRNMQVWSEPASRPDHEFVCFEPTVGSEDALNRPADRLTVEADRSCRIVLQLRAKP